MPEPAARFPAEEMAERAREWGVDDRRVAAVLVYGSVAQGRADEWSDLDLLVVGEPGQRDALWADRATIADRILGEHRVWEQELQWQRDYRFQAYRADAVQLDLTLDEGHAQPWRGVADGFAALVDRGGLADRLRADLAGWRPPEHDAYAPDGETWVWLHYLAGRLRRGQRWMVWTGLVSLADQRIVPLLGVSPNAVESALPDAQLRQLHACLPTSVEVDELRRALRATAERYDEALTSWADRTGQPRPGHPLAPAVLDRIRRLGAATPDERLDAVQDPL